MTTSGLVGKPGHLKAQCLCIPGSDVLKLSVTARRVATRRRPSRHHLRSAWTSVAAPDGTLGLWTARLAVRVPDVCVWGYLRDEDPADLPTGLAVSGHMLSWW